MAVMTSTRSGSVFLALVGAFLMVSSSGEALSRAQLEAWSKWNAQVDEVTHKAIGLIGRTERLDELSRGLVAGKEDKETARLQGAAIISDLRNRLDRLRARARSLPPPPVLPDQTRNKAGQSKRLYAEKLTGEVARILNASIQIYDDAIAGQGAIEKQLYVKFSHQMIVRLEARNEENFAAIAAQPADPRHPQYHLISCEVETNEAMMAIWRAIIDVSHGQDAARIHARMQRRIMRAESRVKQLTRQGRNQVEIYRKLFNDGRKRGEYPRAEIDLLNRMMDTYDPAYEVEEKIARALLAYSELPHMAAQTDNHRRQAEQILGSIGPLAEERERLQARRTQMAGQL